ncbi:hypothetical protein LMG28688_01673 [Paraburkholderia caffeinitolerans]|uniref:Uncharacterized protein n=1 Tax=Paraburkholderia caffeinitolerans TaxID=1723730 RepID=A0A6J5FMQ3_9BURK|nr:hypothetical protein [Paraburkholderia caffeinitolerans]CAB3783566.1 hypothetical protein LMG28688_01673 [Paraburkholderia caffeinitolerans]
MKKYLVLGLSVAVLASASVATNTFAQEKTDAEVRQDSGHQVARNQQNASGVGAEMSGSGASGVAGPSGAGKAEPNCVGPASFCTLFFGS